MKVKDIPILKKKVLDILPITQAEVWKKLGIDSSEGSELIRTMLEEKLVKRTKEGGTYLIESPNGDRTKIEVENIPIYTEIEDVPKEIDKKDIPITDKKDIPKKAKTRDMSILQKQVLDMLPVIQSDIWKKLGIDRRTCSRLINSMIEDNLIKKTKHDHTFMIESANEIVQKKDYALLLSNSGKFSPCCGCMTECEPSTCVLLIEWLSQC